MCTMLWKYVETLYTNDTDANNPETWTDGRTDIADTFYKIFQKCPKIRSIEYKAKNRKLCDGRGTAWKVAK